MIREQEGEDVYPRLLVLCIAVDRAFLRGLTNALRAVPVGLYRFAACVQHPCGRKYEGEDQGTEKDAEIQ